VIQASRFGLSIYRSLCAWGGPGTLLSAMSMTRVRSPPRDPGASTHAGGRREDLRTHEGLRGSGDIRQHGWTSRVSVPGLSSNRSDKYPRVIDRGYHHWIVETKLSQRPEFYGERENHILQLGSYFWRTNPGVRHGRDHPPSDSRRARVE